MTLQAGPAPESPASSNRRARGRVRLALFAFLTLLVWGLFAFDRGLWQDDALALGDASQAVNGTGRLFSTGILPTRVLGSWIFVLALVTGKPVLFLQCLYGLAWLSAGVLTAALAQEIFDDASAFLAGCLTLVATSDYLTNSTVAAAYLTSLALCLGGLVGAMRYLRLGRSRALWVCGLLLAASLWTSDIGLVPICMFPLLAAVALGSWSPRLTRVLRVWAAVLLPYLLALIVGLRYSRYGRNVVLDFSAVERLQRGWTHFGYNFTPWRWAFSRPQWFPEPASVLPLWLYVGAAAVATAAFLWVGMRHPPGVAPGRPASNRRRTVMVGLFAVCALGTNTAYASLRVSDAFYRTHLGSRVWVALALGAAMSIACDYGVSRLGASRRKAWAAALLAAGGFVGLGVWGGIERQDFYLASWRQHQRELHSLKDAAPEVRPEAIVVLWQPAHRRYLASEAEYLGLAWMRLLHGSWPADRLWLRSPGRNTECIAEAEGIRCKPERCKHLEDCRPLLRWESLVILSYDPGAGRYRVAETPPAELATDDPSFAERYNPGRLIRHTPWSPFVVGLLAGDRLLGRWVPENSPAGERAGAAPLQVHLQFNGDVGEGSGWEPHVAGRSVQWTMSRRATLRFPIAAGRDLCLSAAITHYLAPDIPAGLRVSANGVAIPIRRAVGGSRTVVSGVVPAAAIPASEAAVELAFTVDRLVSPASLGLSEDARELGLMFDWLTLGPCR